MSGANKDVKLSLTVMINKAKTKVLFAEADGQFVDILLSFLTLPLGRILKVLEKQYGDEAPTIGSLSSLYHSLANLDAAHFVTEGAKKILLDPRSSFEAKCERLKLDISDYHPTEYFYCSNCSHNRFRSVSIYYDKVKCKNCYDKYLKKEVVNKGSEATSKDGVFTIQTASFIISEDLQIFPNETGLLGIITTLGITDIDNAKPINVDFGLTEFMNLLKASLTSPTPLSDIILNKTTQMSTAIVESQPMIAKQDNPISRDLILKVMIQKSTGKLLYAQANKKFIEFLFSLLIIPLGGVERLLAGETCFKAINNLYRSTANLIGGEHLKTSKTKQSLIQPNLPHGYISKNHILPLTEESLSAEYTVYYNTYNFSSVMFPKGQGTYLDGPPTYEVKDDLTVSPYCIVSILSNLREQRIPISDVKEVELEIGLKEALSILKASLASTSALTDALLSQISNKQPKREP